jgi:hypothetical protein
MVPTGPHQHSWLYQLASTSTTGSINWSHQHSNTQLMVSTGLQQPSNTQLHNTTSEHWRDSALHLYWSRISSFASCVTSDLMGIAVCPTIRCHHYNTICIHVELELVGLHQNFQLCFGHTHPWPPSHLAHWSTPLYTTKYNETGSCSTVPSVS